MNTPTSFSLSLPEKEGSVPEHSESLGDDTTGEPAEDSLYGWVVVLACFFLFMVCIGPTNSFGVYLQEYHSHIFPSTPTITLSWIGCLQFGTMCVFSIGAGILVERFDVRLVAIFGCIISGTAFLIASACKSPVALVFTQGIMFGAGGAFVLNPAVSLPGQWMKKYRAIATGAAIAGGPVGGMWMSFATRAMVANIGWQWSLRVTGFLVIGIGLAVSPLLRKRISVPSRARIIDVNALANAQFLILFFATLFVSGGYFMPYYFMSSFTVVGLGRSAAWGANISSILNASSIIGRLATGVMADYIGPLNSLIITSVISTLAILVLWLPFHNLGTLIATALVFGFTSGSAVSLVPVITANIFGTKRLPSIIGMLFMSYAIGTFLCSPIGGVLLDKYGHGTNYSSLIIYGGVFFGVGTLLMIVLRTTMTRSIAKLI